MPSLFSRIVGFSFWVNAQSTSPTPIALWQGVSLLLAIATLKCEVFLGHYYAHDEYYHLADFGIITMGRKAY